MYLPRTSTRRSRQRGNTMVEAALTAIMLFMILFGIVGFGRAVWAYGWVSHAAREASRWAAVRGSQSGRPCSSSDVTSFVAGETAGLDRSQLTVTTTWSASNDPGAYVQVKVQYVVSQIVPWVPAMTVQSTSKFMIAQ